MTSTAMNPAAKYVSRFFPRSRQEWSTDEWLLLEDLITRHRLSDEQVEAIVRQHRIETEYPKISVLAKRMHDCANQFKVADKRDEARGRSVEDQEALAEAEREYTVNRAWWATLNAEAQQAIRERLANMRCCGFALAGLSTAKTEGRAGQRIVMGLYRAVANRMAQESAT